jgi:hypothetical protein
MAQRQLVSDKPADRRRLEPAWKPRGVWSSNPAVALWGTMVGKKIVTWLEREKTSRIESLGLVREPKVLVVGRDERHFALTNANPEFDEVGGSSPPSRSSLSVRSEGRALPSCLHERSSHVQLPAPRIPGRGRGPRRAGTSLRRNEERGTGRPIPPDPRIIARSVAAFRSSRGRF